MPSVGIDLGTTNSCVAVLQSGEVEILANDMASRFTPSCVAFDDDGELLVGESAKEQRKYNPENTISAVKRLMGVELSDGAVTENIKRLPYKVVNDNGRPKIQIATGNGDRAFHPEEISKYILTKMKEVAADRVGEVHNAVVTVPAYFNDAQRCATKDAAKVADLGVLRLLNEPTAAALAYGFQRKIMKKRTVLVYDLGGGTFDVTLLTIEGPEFNVIATGGDTHLGGDDFDQAMQEHVVKELRTKKNIDISDDKIAKAELREKCEKAKLFLTNNHMQKIFVEAKGQRFKTEITRSAFEEMNRELFERTFQIVAKVLSDANMTKYQVDDVVLVGGSTRIPFIQEKLGKMFGEDKIQKNINPDEAVAYGAAVYAAHLSGEVIPGINEIRLEEIIPFSLGTNVIGGRTSVIIPRGTRIPISREEHYTTNVDNQTAVRIDAYEGESKKTKDNRKLGGFSLENVPPKPAGEANIVVKFSVGESGILNVAAWETTRNEIRKIAITVDKKGLTDEEVEKLRKETAQFEEQTAEIREKNLAQNGLEATIHMLRRTRNSEEVQKKCEETEKWLTDKKHAKKEEIVEKQRQLEEFASDRN